MHLQKYLHVVFEGGMLSFVISSDRKEQEEATNFTNKLLYSEKYFTQYITHQNKDISCFNFNFTYYFHSLRRRTMYLQLSIISILCLTFVVIHCENSTKSYTSTTETATTTTTTDADADVVVTSKTNSLPTTAATREESFQSKILYLPQEETFVTFNDSTELHRLSKRRFMPLPPTGRLNKPVYLNEWWKGPSKRQHQTTTERSSHKVITKATSTDSVIRSLVPPKFEKRQDYYHDYPRTFEPLEGIFSPHGSMLDRNSDFYYILPILLVIGLGSFLIPIISTFFTAMITSGGLAGGCCRRRRITEKNTPDLGEKINSLWDSLEKSISKYSKTFSSLADFDLKPNS